MYRKDPYLLHQSMEYMALLVVAFGRTVEEFAGVQPQFEHFEHLAILQVESDNLFIALQAVLDSCTKERGMDLPVRKTACSLLLSSNLTTS